MLHGGLFIAYLTFAIHASHQQKWSVITLLLLFLASIIPFAFLYVELYIRKQLIEKQENSIV
jgi:integral membrane protein